MLAKSLWLALVICLTLNAAAKQAPSSGHGKLAGMVSDPTGAYVPNARIVIKGNRLKKELQSGDDGTYSVDLPPGSYSVRFGYPGFTPVRKRVRITRDAVTKFDVTLQLDPKYMETVYEARAAGAPLAVSSDGRHNNGMHPTRDTHHFIFQQRLGRAGDAGR